MSIDNGQSRQRGTQTRNARTARPLSRRQRRKHRLEKGRGAKATLIALVLVALLAAVYVECVRSTPGESTNVTKGIVLGPVLAGKYKDDTTTGRSKRWFVKVRVSVEFMNGKITNIDVVSHRHFWKKAKAATRDIPEQIVARQNTKVDAVSGATLSSTAIMLAVQDALNNNQKKNKWDYYERTGEGGRWDDKY